MVTITLDEDLVEAMATMAREADLPLSGVVGEAWRDGRRQVQLARALAGCRADPAGLDTSKAAGVLCGRSSTADVVDAMVVVMAAALRAIIWTSDPRDITALAGQSGITPAPVVRGV